MTPGSSERRSSNGSVFRLHKGLSLQGLSRGLDLAEMRNKGLFGQDPKLQLSESIPRAWASLSEPTMEAAWDIYREEEWEAQNQ
jgi:hypothetical protein